MAKKQSFGEKAGKKKVELTTKTVKAIFSVYSAKTQSWKFSEKFVKVPIDADETKFLEEEYSRLS